jgi:MFS family permease
VFVFIESRARIPIVPLDLWRNRTYVSSMISTFFVSFGFFGAVIFLPRWFQVVRHESATNSGYQLMPLLIGLIGSSILAGILVSRTGRYKPIILFGVAVMAVGIYLMTGIRTDTEQTSLWVWMFVTGVGIGPTLSVFTIVVQNAVPFQKLGVATSNLTFFRQIGGSVGLAIAGTVFGQALREQLPAQLTPVFGQIVSSLPPAAQSQAQAQIAALGSGGASGLDLNQFAGVGQSFGTFIASTVPGPFQQFVQPFIGQLDRAFYDAFSIGVSQGFVLGIVAAIAAFVAALVMAEIPLRSANAAPAQAAGQPAPAYRAVPEAD